MELVTGLTGQLHQPLLDEMVNILDRRIVILGYAFTADLIQGGQRRRKLTVIQDAYGCQRGGVGPARRHLVRQQRAVERKRALPLLEVRILSLSETARPHLHFQLSACTSARERAGNPRIRMKPSASFCW